MTNKKLERVKENKMVGAVTAIIKYIVTFMVFMWAAIPIHEWLHLEVLKLLGGDGYIIKTMFGGAGVHITVQPTNPSIVALAGGIGVAGLYGLVMLFDWLHKDNIGAAALLPIVLYQLCYGIVEGALFFNVPRAEFNAIILPVGIIAWGVGAFISIIWMVKEVVDRYS